MFRVALTYLKTIGLRGLLTAVAAKLRNSTLLFTIRREECGYPFHVRIPSGDLGVFTQIFIKGEYDFRAERQPEAIVDAGANIGLASVYFANRFPEAKIIAIEPEAGNFDLLTKNVRHYPNVVPVQAALWNTNEELNLLDSGLGTTAYMTERKNPEGKISGNTCHTVMAMTMDKIMEDYGFGKIDILKIDIEGAEKEVFSDPSSWIDKVDAIIIELHERMKAGCIRSFYDGSSGFDSEWMQGENVFLARERGVVRQMGNRLSVG